MQMKSSKLSFFKKYKQKNSNPKSKNKNSKSEVLKIIKIIKSQVFFIVFSNIF